MLAMPLSSTLAACLFFTTAGAVDPATKPPEPTTVTVAGKVVGLADALRRRGIEADPGPIEGQVAVEAVGGEIVPIVSDEASRALFLDKRLRDRRAEVVGRRFVGVPYLQVVTFRVEEEGKLRTPEYYCEICTISVRYPQICPCCQGEMVLRMRPEGR